MTRDAVGCSGFSGDALEVRAEESAGAVLDEMERIVPWSTLLSLVRPHCAKAGNGRRPVGLEIMLRIYFVQQWFNLSDPGVEEALYESPELQRFVGVDLGSAPAPDETTVCRFRHLLEKHDLCGMMLES